MTRTTAGQRRYKSYGPYDYATALEAVKHACQYDDTKARAALEIASHLGLNAEPAPKGLINITFERGEGWTIEDRQG